MAPKTTDILCLHSDHIGQFLKDQMRAKMLTKMMKQLNNDLLSNDATARDMARRALDHLGFAAQP